MTHYRTPGSIDDVLLKAINILSPECIKAATGKAYDTFNKISRPINDLGLHMEDAIALDQALVKAGHPDMFFDHYAERMLNFMAPPTPNIPLPDRMMKIMGEVGDVARVVEEALKHSSESGVGLSLNERREISKQANEAKDQLVALLSTVEIKNPEEVKGVGE